MSTRSIVIVIIVIAVVAFAVSVFLSSNSKSLRTTKALRLQDFRLFKKEEVRLDTFYRVKSVQLVQPLFDKVTIVCVTLDSPTHKIKCYKDVDTNVAASILEVYGLKHCLFNSAGEKFIGSNYKVDLSLYETK